MIEQSEPEKESFVNREEWVEATNESEMRALVQFFKERILPDDPREKQQTLAYAPFYTLIEGLLFRCDQKTGNLHLFVPRKFRQKLIEERHSGVCAGHLSAKKIYMQLAEKYFWNNMRADCSQAVAKCRICAYTREPRSNQPGLKTVKTSEPLELVCLDVLEIGRSRAKNRYILVCVDHFSKCTVAEPIPNKMAETIARAFVENFILIYGAPKRIHSDRGKEFVNSTLENITKILKTEVSTTRGYDPQANGLVERMNHTIIRLLKRTTPSEWDWDIRLPYVVFAINATPSETTGFSPYTLMFGRTINFPTDKNISLGVDPRYTVDEETYLQLFRENLANIIGEARENTKIAQERQKLDFDKRPCVTEKKFVKGERVMVIYPSEAKKLTNKKLGWNHFGPFKILEVTESSAVLIPVDKPNDDKITVPLERLIKIPTPGIPDISILPKKKTPFKQLFATLFILNEKEKTENFKNFNLKLSETTNFLEEDEDSKCIDWTKACQGEGHEECSPLEISELDPVLGRQTTLGTKIAKTPLQALLTTFILRQFSSSTAARRLTQTIIEGEPKEEFIMFIGGKGDLIPKDVFPKEEDLKIALEAWIRSCNYSFQSLQESGFSPIHIKIPIMPFTTRQQVEQKAWCDLFTLANWILEEIRAKVIHRKQLITLPRVILGDSSAVQLTKEMTNIKALINEEEGLSGIIRAISSVILSSKVKGLLIVIGRDALLQNVNLETIQENFNRIREICSPYTHLQILWAIPPYIHSKKEEYEELIRVMPTLLAGSNIKLGLVGENGRSLGEVFRYGESFAGHRINKNGLMTEHCVKAMLAWIYSVGSFPGEKEEGRKRIHSRIVVVRPESETPMRREDRGSLGDRRHPTDHRSPIRRKQYRLRSSNYRSPIRNRPYKQERSSVSWRR
uniref:RNA-directed DNA polymerase n=1 Tax=Meloidogyne incognita TaxID=6306 RepID=A0A914M129_MELIC